MRRRGRRIFLSVILDKGSKSTLVVASPREKCFNKCIQNKFDLDVCGFTGREELGSNLNSKLTPT